MILSNTPSDTVSETPSNRVSKTPSNTVSLSQPVRDPPSRFGRPAHRTDNMPAPDAPWQLAPRFAGTVGQPQPVIGPA
jgi:hypothetical protein